MAAFDVHGILVPDEIAEDIPVILGIGVRQDVPHVIKGVEAPPRFPVRGMPLTGRKVRVPRGLMKGIIRVQIGIHVLPGVHHARMILRAGQRRQHEE